MEFAKEQIVACTQEATVRDYCDSFLFLFNQVRNCEEFTDFYAIYLFICGLKPRIRSIFVKWHQYSCFSVEDVISLALKIDINNLNDSFSPFDPESSFYMKGLEFDFKKSLWELMEGNECFENGKIQEVITSDTTKIRTSVLKHQDNQLVTFDVEKDDDDDDFTIQGFSADYEVFDVNGSRENGGVIDNDVLSENGNDTRTAPKVFDGMPKRFENDIQEALDSEIQDIIVQELFDIKGFNKVAKDKKHDRVHTDFCNGEQEKEYAYDKKVLNQDLAIEFVTGLLRMMKKQSVLMFLVASKKILRKSFDPWKKTKRLYWIDTGWLCKRECRSGETRGSKYPVEQVNRNKVWEVGDHHEWKSWLIRDMGSNDSEMSSCNRNQEGIIVFGFNVNPSWLLLSNSKLNTFMIGGLLQGTIYLIFDFGHSSLRGTFGSYSKDYQLFMWTVRFLVEQGIEKYYLSKLSVLVTLNIVKIQIATRKFERNSDYSSQNKLERNTNEEDIFLKFKNEAETQLQKLLGVINIKVELSCKEKALNKFMQGVRIKAAVLKKIYEVGVYMEHKGKSNLFEKDEGLVSLDGVWKPLCWCYYQQVYERENTFDVGLINNYYNLLEEVLMFKSIHSVLIMVWVCCFYYKHLLARLLKKAACTTTRLDKVLVMPYNALEANERKTMQLYPKTLFGLIAVACSNWSFCGKLCCYGIDLLKAINFKGKTD